MSETKYHSIHVLEPAWTAFRFGLISSRPIPNAESVKKNFEVMHFMPGGPSVRPKKSARISSLVVGAMVYTI